MIMKSTFLSPVDSLEYYRRRLSCRRQRRLKTRQLILRSLLGDSHIPLLPGQLNSAFSDVAYQSTLSCVLQDRLKCQSNTNSSSDEMAIKKCLIMPVLRRVQTSRLSSLLLSLLSQDLDGVSLSDAYAFSNGNLTRRGGDAHTSSSLPGSKEEVFYSGTSTFLKGTQSSNPHNDYCQHFVDTGKRPQNFIRDTGLRNRFEEYPKLRELIRLKDELIQARATPPMYLRADLRTFNLQDLKSVFDVILVEPPLDRSWSWEEIEMLEIEKIAAPRSFIWIWCGSGEGLDGARKCLKKWGFRRCEDICWIKTNKTRPCHEQLEPGAVLQRTKEHCLMGIHGTVRRSVDGDFIHANLDIDLIISEAKQPGSYGEKDKPTEIFHIIEHFCLGRRRLHLFGRDSTLRAGWLTVGSELSASNFDAQVYTNYFNREPNGHLVGSSDEIERLRPKSPPPPPSVTASMGPIAQRPRTGVLLQPTVTPSLLGKPASVGGGERLIQLPNVRHRVMGAVDQNTMLNLLSFPVQNSLPHGLLVPPVGQAPRSEVLSPADLASLQTALLLQQSSQRFISHLAASTASGLGNTEKMALAMQMFAAAATSLQQQQQ